jgi:hypothetical protein
MRARLSSTAAQPLMASGPVLRQIEHLLLDLSLSRAALTVADAICPSIQTALDLLLEPKALATTLRP